MADVVSRDMDEIAAWPLPWQGLAGATVLVSGAHGMLGGYLVRALLRLNQGPLKEAPLRVLALGRSRAKAQAAFGPLLDGRWLQLLEQDVCAPCDPAGPVDYVVHAASPASPRHYSLDPVGALDANILGTRSLLDLARRKASRGFLYVSSSEVYGRGAGDGGPIAEDAYGAVDPMQVRSCYAEGKRAGEALCAAWAQQHKVPAVVARPFHTYAPTLRLDDGRIYADLVADLLAGRGLALSSDGSARRAFCYATDATAAFLLMLLKGEPGKAYNVGNPGQECSMLELARTLAGLYPERGLQVTAKAPPPGYLASAVDRNLPDVSRLRALGWEPRVGIAEGFRRVVEHHEAR